ncbi:MAG: hypothetical protein HS108_03250 [Planctomycetes bacterium]|jgi:hypothetical protein|nr:hypothetical protein [Planctomycetota bacterium]MCL4728918.1 hypothetical protein [Planctomycetota bacterium]
MKTFNAALLGLSLLVMLMAPTQADSDTGWELLGTREVSFENDKDVIEVTAKEGLFKAIRIKVEDGNLEMHGIKVTFGNDEAWEPDVRAVFKEDSRSRDIDLPGEARFIKRVSFKYESKRKRGKAEVKLYGKQAGGKAEPGKSDLGKRHAGFEHLGTRQVNFLADKDTIDVSDEDGRFVALVIDVDDGELAVHKIKLTFGNGETFEPEVRHEFKEGSRSRQIDLPGEKRAIRKVELSYKSRLKEGRATVHLFGKRAGTEPSKDRHPGYKVIATRTVDFAKDTDVLIIGESKGKFSSLIIEVEDGELEMHDFTITFGNGKQHSPELRAEFKEGSRSRQIDLPGEQRTIERITFKYRSTKLREGKAEVRLYGK